MSMVRKARRWWRLGPEKRWLLLEAAFWLGVMRAAIRLLSFKQIVRVLRLKAGESPFVPDSQQSKTAQQIRWAVESMAPRIPWETLCLVQGLAGAAMLRRRHLPLSLYFGVAKTEQGEFQAHAWLCCGDQVLTGGAGRQRFSVIAAYC
ncbi:MAG TPA: lasso peptide biosynthesis B2 protein [Anaerolineae bacterium]|nr:lasso peptide biosynthesis B2 protein [Anaerolineae bacterium]